MKGMESSGANNINRKDTSPAEKILSSGKIPVFTPEGVLLEFADSDDGARRIFQKYMQEADLH